jgi:transcriptional regulator GlxA family with amidase domain
MNRDMRSLCDQVGTMICSNPCLTLRELARSIGTDRHNIEHAMRKHCSPSFRELKKQARLNRAMILLLEGPIHYSVKEIAADIGVTPNALSRFIKLMTGYGATELRCQK